MSRPSLPFVSKNVVGSILLRNASRRFALLDDIAQATILSQSVRLASLFIKLAPLERPLNIHVHCGEVDPRKYFFFNVHTRCYYDDSC